MHKTSDLEILISSCLIRWYECSHEVTKWNSGITLLHSITVVTFQSHCYKVKDLKILRNTFFYPPQKRHTIIFYLPVGETHHYFVYSLGHESSGIWHFFLLPHALTRVLCLKDDNRKNLTLSYQKSIHMMSKSHKHQHQRKFDRIQRKKLSPGKIGGVETKEVKAADCSENICLFFYSLQIHHSYNKG